MLHPRLFRLIELHQRIDDRLRDALWRARGLEIARLRSLKRKARRLIHRFTMRDALA